MKKVKSYTKGTVLFVYINGLPKGVYIKGGKKDIIK